MPLRQKAQDLAAKYKFNPFVLNQVMDELATAGLDPDAIDWLTVVQDTADLGITIDNLYSKLQEYYKISRPHEAVPARELELIEERAKEYEEEQLRDMIETAVSRVAESERLALRDYVYEELKRVLLETPEAKSKEGIQLLKIAIQNFEKRLVDQEVEFKTTLQNTTRSMLDAGEMRFRAELGNLRKQVLESLKAPKPTPALFKAQERLKAPSPPEEIVPEGYTRERIVTTTERKRDALTEKETGIIEFHEIPPEVAVFRAPDGRLIQVKDRKMKEITIPEILKLIYPRVSKPPLIGPGAPRETIPLGVPIFMTPVARLDVVDVLKTTEVIKREDPEFYAKLKAEGKTLQEIVNEWRRLKELR